VVGKKRNMVENGVLEKLSNEEAERDESEGGES
jgi:hypothetical protein